VTWLFTPPAQTALAVANETLQFPVRRVYCVGRNYAEHAREMGDDPERSEPFFFAKPTDAVICAPEEIRYPPATENLHHEVELVVAIDGAGSNLSADDAAGLVCGCAVGVDLTRRDLQADAKAHGRPWVTAKGFDQSAPVSPLHMLSIDSLHGDAEIWLRVNDTLRQQATLAEMIWSVPELLANLSSYFALAPGDLVFTGTPAGVGPLQRGDRVDCAIDSIAALSFTLI
jgi:fumarylpyruvate hydrolase